MDNNTVICGNKTCPNYDGQGCNKSYIILNHAGKCVSSEQRMEEKTDAELAGNHVGK